MADKKNKVRWALDEKKAAYAKTDGRCFYCGEKASTIDHFFPFSKYPGLIHEPTNLLPACMSCNEAKGDKDASEALPKRPWWGEENGVCSPRLTDYVSPSRAKGTLPGIKPRRLKDKRKTYEGVPYR